MSKFKMRGGTAQSDEHLCRNCRFAQNVQGHMLKERITYCSSFSRQVPFRVAECSEYDDKSRPSLWAMKDTAWILTTKSAGRGIGFVKKSSLSEREKRELEDL